MNTNMRHNIMDEDLSKSFDTIKHPLLLSQLEAFGFVPFTVRVCRKVPI